MKKIVFSVEGTVADTIASFNAMVADFGVGHALTPDQNRGMNAAFCRMLRCRPLTSEIDYQAVEKNSSRSSLQPVTFRDDTKIRPELNYLLLQLLHSIAKPW